MLDPVAVERAESEIDNFILKRNRDREDANRVEAAWALSEARHRARRREENRAAWLEYYEKMNRLHLGIAAEHASRRSRLLAEDYTGFDEGPDGEAGHA
jgi:hypothetical protein